MDDLRVVISGDYWHHEFQSIVSEFPSPVTLTPIDRLESLLDESFNLIVLAQSRPDQIPSDLVERIQASHPSTPIVALLGSWCEGGMRSDVPWPGVRRIYWHQWAGRFEQFSKQLAEVGLTLWHQPGTASDADNAMLIGEFDEESTLGILVAISAADQAQYKYVRDAVEAFGWSSCWAERATFDQETIEMVSAVCVDANSFGEDLSSRIEWLQAKLESKPTTLLLNFPRSQDVNAAADHGIQDIVSKPFQPNDLKHAIESSIGRQQAGNSGSARVPSPHRAKSVSRT